MFVACHLEKIRIPNTLSCTCDQPLLAAYPPTTESWSPSVQKHRVTSSSGQRKMSRVNPSGIINNMFEHVWTLEKLENIFQHQTIIGKTGKRCPSWRGSCGSPTSYHHWQPKPIKIHKVCIPIVYPFSPYQWSMFWMVNGPRMTPPWQRGLVFQAGLRRRGRRDGAVDGVKGAHSLGRTWKMISISLYLYIYRIL